MKNIVIAALIAVSTALTFVAPAKAECTYFYNGSGWFRTC